MSVPLIALISLICTALGVLIGGLTLNRNVKQDTKRDAAEDAVVRTKLDHISAGVESIRLDMKASEGRMEILSERVIRVEESAKQAHKRIDQFAEGKVTRND